MADQPEEYTVCSNPTFHPEVCLLKRSCGGCQVPRHAKHGHNRHTVTRSYDIKYMMHYRQVHALM